METWQEISATVFGQPKLDTEAQMESARIMKMQQCVTPSRNFVLGKRAGSSVAVRLYTSITDSGTSPVSENDSLPYSDVPSYVVQTTVYRYGRAVLWTGEREDLDRLDIREASVELLTRHAAETQDTLIYNAAVAARSYTYTPTASTTATFNDDGTFTDQMDSPFTLWHAWDLYEKLLDNNVPTFDGTNYLGIFSPKLCGNVRKDQAENGFVSVKKYQNADDALNGEIGTVANIRIVQENHANARAIGASSAFGGGMVFGHDAIREVPVYPIHLRFNENVGDDFGNQNALAWQMISGWKGVWNATTHGQGSICQIGST